MSTTKQRMQTMAQNTKRMQAKAREAASCRTLLPRELQPAPAREEPDDELNHPTIGKHAGMTRGYFRSDLIWPGLHVEPDIMIGFYDEPDGGTTGEFRIAWSDIGPQLQVFDDGWSALSAMPDLIIELGELKEVGGGTRPVDIQALLERLGFADNRNSKSKMTDAERQELALLIG